MAYTKKESLVQYGDWDERSDSHPAMNWMRKYTAVIDKNDFDAIWNDGGYISQSFKYVQSSGQSFPAGKDSFMAVKQSYSFFTKFHHEPYFFTCWDLDSGDGWAMTGNAWLYYNLPGGDGSGSKVTDLTGEGWEGRVPSGFYFEYKKESGGKDGIKITSTSITSDSGPIVTALLQRGVLKPSDLGLWG